MDNKFSTNLWRYKKYIFIAIYVLVYILFEIVLVLPWYYFPIACAIITSVLIFLFYPSFLGFMANIYFTSGKQDKAEKLYKKAIDKKCKNPTVYLNYGVLLIKNNNARDALQYLEMGKKLNPNTLTDKNILLTIGSCYWVLGELDKAIETLEHLRAKYSYVSSTALVTLGYVYYIKGDFENAVKFTTQALKDSPENGAAWDNLGQINYKKGNVDEAKEHFKKAIGYKSDLVDSYYYLGLIFEQENQYEKAKEYFGGAKSCSITTLNTVTREQVMEKYNKYWS